MANEQIQASDTRFPPAAHLPGEEANWVIGVLYDEAAGEQARAAALQAGFAPEQVLLLHAQAALERAQAQQENMTPIARFFASLSRVATDPGNAETEYVTEAQEGHSLLSLKASDPEQVALAQRVLLDSDARRVKYFGEWTITTLS